jgi:hypothetical protein
MLPLGSRNSSGRVMPPIVKAGMVVMGTPATALKRDA